MAHTAPEQPTHPEHSARHQEVLSYFQSQQAQDPMFLQRLLDSAHADWERLPEAEREAVSMVGRFLHPDNLTDRSQAAKEYLLIHRLVQEFILADTLELQHTLPAHRSSDA